MDYFSQKYVRQCKNELIFKKRTVNWVVTAEIDWVIRIRPFMNNSRPIRVLTCEMGPYQSI